MKQSKIIGSKTPNTFIITKFNKNYGNINKRKKRKRGNLVF